MVASLSALSSAAQAGSYYEADDFYYSENNTSPSEWLGDAAARLGVSGTIDRASFNALLEGRLPNGVILGTGKTGVAAHRPGWDLTFSAPKSVSIAALIGGDHRLVEAHRDAVAKTLSILEVHAAETRVRDGASMKAIRTGTLAVASFLHQTSREQDPQLHTHGVILNATVDRDGVWRSLESRPIYQIQKALGELYRQELAHAAVKLGYEVEFKKDSLFELKGVPQEMVEHFSRRSAQVEAQLAERGKTRETATAEEKQIAALGSRKSKAEVDRSELAALWRERATTCGADALTKVIGQAIASAAEPGRARSLKFDADLSAKAAVTFASAKLGERDAVFSAIDLQREAGRFARGRADGTAIQSAINAALATKALEPREYQRKSGQRLSGFTTKTNIENEQRLLNAEFRGRGQSEPLATSCQAADAVAAAALKAERSGFSWTADQRAATQGLLTSRHRVTGVQGYAGSAKTTTVIATYAEVAKAKGLDVRLMAPSASAANTLGEALSAKAETVERHLRREEQLKSPRARPNEIWVVDEAGLLSAKDMRRLLEAAEARQVRTVLVGDIKQLGSVGAGAAFRQLQDAGMAMVQLTEIVRQTNTLTLEAVYHSIEGQARKVLDALDRGGGLVIEEKDADRRFSKIVSAFVSMSPEERRATLVIEPSREGRDRLTQNIRQALMTRGELSAEALSFRTLVPKDLTKAEQAQARAYEVGDVIVCAVDDKSQRMAKGASFEVADSDTARGIVTLRDGRGRTIVWRPETAQGIEVFQSQVIDLRRGDQVEFIKNQSRLGRFNGLVATVSEIDTRRGSIRLRAENGRTISLNKTEIQDQHLRHAYVSTAHAAQGKTAERVLVHFDSQRANLVDQSTTYVAISRGKMDATIFTDDRHALVRGLESRTGKSQIALEVGGQPTTRSTSKDAGIEL